MANPFPRGSEWRRWDLHVHTPFSYLNNQFPNNWDEYVQGLFRAAISKEIAALGITDYFTIDGYKKIKQEYLGVPAKMEALFSPDEIKAINELLIIPNIEFRLDKFVGNSGSINFHLIFSEEVQIEYIEENFLHDIDFVYEGNPQSNEEKYKLKVNNLIALGARLRSQHAKFREKSDICVGMMNAVVNDGQISEILEGAPSKFRGKYLVGVVADEDLSGISWNSRDHQTRKVLIQKSDFLFSSNPKTRDWALGRPPYGDGEEKFIEEFKTLKPCLWGSDAHELQNIGHPCLHHGKTGHRCGAAGGQPCELRTTWIKADLTFEGLKQLLYEPSERVSIQREPVARVKASVGPVIGEYPIEQIAK